MEHPEFTRIITALARIEQKVDGQNEVVKKNQTDIESLQKKWWSGVGAFFLAVSLWIKNLVT